jgi:NADH-quinone oxidoreductase subunit N
MNHQDLLALLPLIIPGYAAVVLLVLGAFWRSHSGMAILTLATLVTSSIAAVAVLPLAPRQVTPLARIDTIALAYMVLFYLAGIAITIFAYDYLHFHRGSEKFFSLLLLALVGMATLVTCSHFVSFIAALEILSVALYGLVGYSLKRPTSLEASLKYLVLAGVSLAFLLLGMALIYFHYGTMDFHVLAPAFDLTRRHLSPLVPVGLGLLLVGFAFKLAIVPFHTWAPDVYQGAAAPISALIATGSKGALFILLIRFIFYAHLDAIKPILLALTILAIITMFGGNLLALLQRNLKRLLAYSSITHIGYLLIALLAGGERGLAAINFYFVSYFATTIIAFGVISVLAGRWEELEDLEHYRGLGLRRPWLGAVLALAMLSLTGIPPTIGFMAKLLIFAAAAQSGLWLLLVIGLINSGLSAYYYLRVLITLYLPPAEPSTPLPVARFASAAILVILIIIVLVFGIYPTPLLTLATQVSQTLFNMH